eukprot:12694998-Alexandrium_andersonii.AAC.1
MAAAGNASAAAASSTTTAPGSLGLPGSPPGTPRRRARQPCCTTSRIARDIARWGPMLGRRTHGRRSPTAQDHRTAQQGPGGDSQEGG